MNPAFIREHIDLQPLHTLALPAHARYFAAIETQQQLREAVSWARANNLPLLILGGGSNVILRGEWPGLVLQIALLGKQLQRAGDHALATIAAGENWHALVQWSLREQLFGLENLTLIPGTAGAAPIQNIGAYGVELASVLHGVRGYSLDNDAFIELSAAECQLGYRDSIFKHALRDRFIITEIVLQLRARFEPVLTYPALRDNLQGQAIDALAIERAVRAIRQSKLPDPAQLPNAGSFFKNPVISAGHYAELVERYVDVPHFPAVSGIKVPAGWLVDKAGWKGRRSGHVGVHAEQALVLIHYGGGSADELLALAQSIQTDVWRQFGIALELEPTLYGV
jgi:UDP-N-acetylmuramate dehydrogenase